MKQFPHLRSEEADGELLRRFLRSGSEVDFSALVQRHGPMVWSVCRNLLQHEADAEDAFQAVFLTLFRSSGRIRQTGNPGAWLHGVAVKVCLKSRDKRQTRRSRESHAASLRPTFTVTGESWQDESLLVHQAITELPKREREVFVQCILQGLGQAEVARNLKLQPKTVSGLLCRARKRMQQRFRNTTLAASTGMLLASSASAGVPLPVFAAACKIPTSGGLLTPAVLSLTQSVLEIPMRKFFLLGCLLLSTATLCGLGGHWLSKAEAQGYPFTKQDGGTSHLTTEQIHGTIQSNPLSTGETEGDPARARWVRTASSDWIVEHQAHSARTTYEYEVIQNESTRSLKTILNNLAKEGWELTGPPTFMKGEDGRVVTFAVLKRPRQAASATNIPINPVKPAPGGGGTATTTYGPVTADLTYAKAVSSLKDLKTVNSRPVKEENKKSWTIALNTLDASSVATLIQKLDLKVSLTIDPRTNSLVFSADSDEE